VVSTPPITIGSATAPVGPRTTEAAPRQPGDLIGRYRVEGTLGRGGMGVVYDAFDPDLERHVAIKLLAPSQRSPKATALLRREAKAMAKVVHPNVIIVVDVGQDGAEVYVAMERIEGVTLREWLDASPRSQQEVLAIFEHAGRGLAALHQAGLVHRDFKPDNVMVAGDRVVVMDLGLAAESALDSGSESDSQVAKTFAGVVGTPAYMSPEQFANGQTDARSDQFTFAVALFEALFGERPFAGSSTLELVHSLETQTARAPTEAGVPRRTGRALERALLHDPTARFESIEALLAALRPPNRRRAWPIAASVLLLAVATSYAALSNCKSVAACGDPAQELAEIWDDDVREEIAASFAAYGPSYLRRRHAAVDIMLDQQASLWQVRYAEVCEAVARQAEGADDAMFCLQQRKAELRGLLAALREGDRDSADAIVSNAQPLSSIAECLDTPDPAPAPAEQALMLRIDEAAARIQAADYDSAVELLAEVDETSAPASESLQLALATLRGDVGLGSGDYEAATDAFAAAYFAALSLDRDAAALEAALRVTSTYANLSRDSDRARHWRRVTEAATPAEAGRVPLQIRALTATGAALNVEGDPQAALEKLEQALRLAQQELGDGHPATAVAANHLGGILYGMRRWEEALGYYTLALRLHIGAFGANHPGVARATGNIANALIELDRAAEAVAKYDAAISIAREAYGGDHPEIGNFLVGRAEAGLKLGRVEEAFADVVAGQRILEAILDADHPLVQYADEQREQVEAARRAPPRSAIPPP